VTRQQTANKNAATELAFASCAAEEDQLRSPDPEISAMLMPHLKAQAKAVLIETGSLNISSK
jgi:hypothetical protein